MKNKLKVLTYISAGFLVLLIVLQCLSGSLYAIKLRKAINHNNSIFKESLDSVEEVHRIVYGEETIEVTLEDDTLDTIEYDNVVFVENIEEGRIVKHNNEVILLQGVIQGFKKGIFDFEHMFTEIVTSIFVVFLLVMMGYRNKSCKVSLRIKNIMIGCVLASIVIETIIITYNFYDYVGEIYKIV